MPRSFGQNVGPVPCPKCGRAIYPMTWIVVDLGEHPELLPLAMDGRLRLSACPHCGTTSLLNSMLLLYVPQVEPHLIFFPANGSSEAEAEDQLSVMLEHVGRDGEVDVDDPPLVGPISLLPMLATKVVQGRTYQDLVEYSLPAGALAGNETYEWSLRNLRHRRLVQDLRAIMQLMLTDYSFVNLRPMVKVRPELRSVQADEFLAHFIAEAEADGSAEALTSSHLLSELRELLRQVRAAGVDAAFDAYADAVRQGTRGPVALAKKQNLALPDWWRPPGPQGRR
jgi:hypothetical protein